MIDLGIRTSFLYTAFRLTVTMARPDGGTTVVSGTGFWVRRNDGSMYLATCRHVVDPIFAGKSGWVRRLVQVSGFRYSKGLADEEPLAFVLLGPPTYPADPHVDLAVFPGDKVAILSGSSDVNSYVEESLLATEEEYGEDISAGDFIVAAGYLDLPDTSNHRPVFLAGIIASDPRVPVEISWGGGRTSRAVLYQSLSRAGLSGAPVFATQRGLQLDQITLTGPPHRPLRVVGVNTGAFRDASQLPLQYSHFVPSSELLKLLSEV
jgi:hypothetical protein